MARCGADEDEPQHTPTQEICPPSGIELLGGHSLETWLSPASLLDGLRAYSKARLLTLPVAWTDADAEPRSTNADARPAIVVAVVVESPRCVIIVPDDHATITSGIPALAGVVTNQPCLVKQRRTVSDLNLVGGIGARVYGGTGAGEEWQCKFSHVHLPSEEAPRANVSPKAPASRKLT